MNNVGTSKTANGWIIGKLPTAFYGVKSDLSCPPQTGWETFAGLEPQPDIVFTKFDADKLRKIISSIVSLKEIVLIHMVVVKQNQMIQTMYQVLT